MVEIRKTSTFTKWLDGLADIRARARILVRIERLAAGNPGDAKPVGEGVFRVADRLRARLSSLLQKARSICGHFAGWW